MNSSQKRDEWLLGMLKEAYLEKEKLEAGHQWQKVVMHRIREIRNTKVAHNPSIPIFQFAWKLAPVTVFCIIVLTAFLLGSGLTPGYGVFDLLGLDGLEELVLTEMITT